jgi:exodeoxyribonuclease V gamma subunit
MLQLYPSNKTESLAYLIAQIIDRHPPKQVFAEEIILIQSQGMGTWLQQELSTHSGVSALVQCQMPASFIWQLAETLMPEDRHIPIFEKNNARWEIFKRLPEKLEDPKYYSLKKYIIGQQSQFQEHDKAVSQQKTLFELSAVIADVFDAYQNYRPDWIDAWESGNTLSGNILIDSSQAGLKELESWQSDLWRSLYPNIALEERRHRSSLFANLIGRLRSPSEAFKRKLPERLFIFGLSALPPQWLPVMSALGKYVDIHFLVHNPCQYYWGDVLTSTQQLKLEKALVDKGVSLETAADTFLEGNPLLASWGKLGRDYLTLLTDSQDIKEAPSSFFDDELTLSALQYVQYDILKLQVTQYALSQADDSIRFASCHSHLREVEALHDYLFSLLNQHPDIKPKDIIVMMPDVQDFAALIEAVFSRPAYDTHGQAQYLPYGISDQLLSMDQPLLDTLSGLLSLSSSRITGAVLLDWLEMPAIRSRFSISEPEMEDIKEWIKHLNIRWGLSESHRDKLLHVRGSGQGNTWLNAAKRLLAGYIFGQDNIYTHAEEELLAFPQRSPEKQILTGKLMRFLDMIEWSISLQSKQFKLEEWLSELSKLWQTWLDFELVSADIQMLLNNFEAEIQKEISQTGFDQPVSFSVIASVLKAQFENQRVSQRFLAGRINFCTLMPMRSIPFKTVCMLGLNEGAYPRPVQGQSFDLLTLTHSRTGDRSRREDDRYLFLEALCSARSHLYISYCGRNIQDNSERYPSILVIELQNYCADNFMLEDRDFEKDETILDHCLVEHHLQPFHQGYYFNDLINDQISAKKDSQHKRLDKTFATEWLPLINHKIEQQILESDFKGSDFNGTARLEAEEQLDLFGASQKTPQVQIDFDRLLECVSQPLRYYYRTALQVNLHSVGDEMIESEPFSIQGLAAYDLKKDLVQNWFEGQSQEANSPGLMKRWQLAGKLPRAPLDGYYMEHVQASLKPMYDYVCENISDESIHHEFDVSLGKYQVSGSLVTHGNQLVEMALSKSLGSSFFSFWIKHVFWSLHCSRTDRSLADSLQGAESRLIGPESEILVSLLSSDQAEQFALECCEFFESASVEPFAFFAKSTYALLFESESKAKGAFAGNQNIPGENSDLYWQRYCLMNGSMSGLMKTQSEPIDWQVLPELESSIFFQQVDSIRESIEIKKIQLNVESNKQGISEAEDQS